MNRLINNANNCFSLCIEKGDHTSKGSSFFFRKHKTHLCCKFSQLLTVTGAEELTSNIPDGRLTSAPLNINS